MPSVLLRDAETKLAEGYVVGKHTYEEANPGKHISITCTHRSVEEQLRLYAQGRTTPGQIVTFCDGIEKKSNHNHYPSRALDFCVTIGGKVTWDEKEYEEAGPFFVAQGLEWGGHWKKFKDLPHIELP